MSEWTVESFLKRIGVERADIDPAAKALRKAGYTTEAYLLAAKRESLISIGVRLPFIDLILNHQYQQQQQQQQDAVQDHATGRKRPNFVASSYDFSRYLNSSINNIDDGELLERDGIQKDILESSKGTPANPKPVCVTLWSGRGSGKTSLLRRMVLKSDDLKKQRECGRLMVVDCKRLEPSMSELRNGGSSIETFVSALVVDHLCRIYGETVVDGIEFVGNPPIGKLWDKPNDFPTLSTILKKDSANAYDIWRKCTQSVFGEEYSDTKPVIFFDTAEVLCVQSENVGRETEATPAQHTHVDGDNSSPRYTVLEWLMMQIPTQHALVAIGTGARRNFPRPSAFQTHVHHMPLAPLVALSEDAVKKLFLTYRLKSEKDLDTSDWREIRLVHAVTAGVPRMVVTAFQEQGGTLTSTNIEKWQGQIESFYADTSRFTETDDQTRSLAKAIITCAVFDVSYSDDSCIPGEKSTWKQLRWDSILTVSGHESYCRIPRLLWSHGESSSNKLQKWVKKHCKFDLNDLMPTPKQLFEAQGSSSSLSSGIPWEKMFASALVGRFFYLCWEKKQDPQGHFLSLKELVPQDDKFVNETLDMFEVCLADGIVVKEKEVFASLDDSFGKTPLTTIYANWNVNSAHHDMILPVRLKKTQECQLWGISARNGHHKTASELVKTKQHLVRKPKNNERDEDIGKVAGLIQAVNPRLKPRNCNLTGVIEEMHQARKYVTLHFQEGQCHHLLSCFD